MFPDHDDEEFEQRGQAWPKVYRCKSCNGGIKFSGGKAFNHVDGTPHRCYKKKEAPPVPQDGTLFALGAMNAIVNAQIQAGGVDFIHRMNFYDVADSAWRLAAAMHKKEKEFREDFQAN